MNIKTRDTLRSATIEKLLSVFPGAQLVKSATGSGIGYVSDVIDEETGSPYVVVMNVSVPLTADTQRSKAFDFDAAVVWLTPQRRLLRNPRRLKLLLVVKRTLRL